MGRIKGIPNRMGPPPKRLDRDGVPIDPIHWTGEDWGDLNDAMNAARAKIAERHRTDSDDDPESRPRCGFHRVGDCQPEAEAKRHADLYHQIGRENERLRSALEFARDAIGRQSKFWKDDPILARVAEDIESALSPAPSPRPPMPEPIQTDGRWRLVENPSMPSVPDAEFRLDDGQWVYPDCGYECDRCGACLGCLRKILLDDESRITPLEDLEYRRCLDGGDHSCRGDDGGES